MINFTCPHCGKRCTRTDLSESDIEYVDLGNGLPDAIFPVLPDGVERHLDMRICCDKCYETAGKVPKALGKPHPYDIARHVERMKTPDKE